MSEKGRIIAKRQITSLTNNQLARFSPFIYFKPFAIINHRARDYSCAVNAIENELIK